MFEIYLLYSNFEHCLRDSTGIVQAIVHHLLHDHVGLHGDHPMDASESKAVRVGHAVPDLLAEGKAYSCCCWSSSLYVRDCVAVKLRQQLTSVPLLLWWQTSSCRRASRWAATACASTSRSRA